MTEINVKDTEFQVHTIDRVEAGSDGWSVSFDGCGLFVPSAQCKTAPSIGEEMRCYGRGFGYGSGSGYGTISGAARKKAA